MPSYKEQYPYGRGEIVQDKVLRNLKNIVPTYTPRKYYPTSYNKLRASFYTGKGHGIGDRKGVSTCLHGAELIAELRKHGYYNRELKWKGSSLPNCVGYAFGRFNEIIWEATGIDPEDQFTFFNWGGNAETLYDTVPTGTQTIYYHGTNRKKELKKQYPKKTFKFKKGQSPCVGAIVVWGYSEGTMGHAAIVEEIIDEETIIISNAGFRSDPPFRQTLTRRGKGKSVTNNLNWHNGEKAYILKGFIYNPYFEPGDYTNVAAGVEKGMSEAEKKVDAIFNNDNDNDTGSLPDIIVSTDWMVKKDANKKINQNAIRAKLYNDNLIQQAEAVNASTTRGIDLLSSSTLVESPFIIAKIGDYTFGSYTKAGTLENSKSEMTVDFPNYMDSLNIVKTNGEINQYTLNMVYQIAPGQDPNLLDRVFSSVANTRDITLSYGDWKLPSFIYSKEEAIITNVTSAVDFANQRITYTLECTSKALKASAVSNSYSAHDDKPASTLIKELLYNTNSGLLELFPGMTSKTKVNAAGLIPTDDKVVSIEAKTLSPLEYLSFLVSCMTSNTNTGKEDTLNDSVYHLIIVDDVENEFGGAYFKIVKIGTTTKTEVSDRIYEVDIGFPTNTLVTNFSINDNSEWAILYNSTEVVDVGNNYKYTIDDNGNVITTSSNNVMSSRKYNKTTSSGRNWWTQVTKHPISATLTIKGLLRPSILMDYVRINSYFYGLKHISSGLYVITKQEDSINMSGYTTTLTLQKVLGDDDEYGY